MPERDAIHALIATAAPLSAIAANSIATPAAAFKRLFVAARPTRLAHTNNRLRKKQSRLERTLKASEPPKAKCSKASAWILGPGHTRTHALVRLVRDLIHADKNLDTISNLEN